CAARGLCRLPSARTAPRRRACAARRAAARRSAGWSRPRGSGRPSPSGRRRGGRSPRGTPAAAAPPASPSAIRVASGPGLPRAVLERPAKYRRVDEYDPAWPLSRPAARARPARRARRPRPEPRPRLRAHPHPPPPCNRLLLGMAGVGLLAGVAGARAALDGGAVGGEVVGDHPLRREALLAVGAQVERVEPVCLLDRGDHLAVGVDDDPAPAVLDHLGN